MTDDARDESEAHDARRRVVLVDDDVWVRRGRAEALRESRRFESVVALDHAAALQFVWKAGDVALVDAHDSSAEFDRFMGVRVTRAIRGALPRDSVRVVVITGHSENGALRERCADAGADYLFAHHDVRSPDALIAVALDPGALTRQLPARTRSGSALDDAIDLVRDSDATDLFDPGRVQKQSALSRRAIITLRERLARTLGVRPTPPLRDLVGMVNEARGSDPPGRQA